MKTPQYLLPAAVVILLIHPSCKKSLPAAGGNTLNKTVQTATANGTTSTQIDSFVYNSQNQLTAISVVVGAGPSSGDTVSFQYEASGRLTSFTQGNGQGGQLCRYDLVYNANGQVVTATATPLLPDYTFNSYSYGYNAEGQLTSDSILAQPNLSQPTLAVMGYDIYTYDENGNVIADTSYRSTNLSPFGPPYAETGAQYYQYDTHVNPYYNIGIPLDNPVLPNIVTLSKDNLLSASSTSSSVQPYGYSYSYYSNARPRTQVLVSPSRLNATPPTTYTTEYFYQ